LQRRKRSCFILLVHGLHQQALRKFNTWLWLVAVVVVAVIQQTTAQAVVVLVVS
jgi:hypothetical protein